MVQRYDEIRNGGKSMSGNYITTKSGKKIWMPSEKSIKRFQRIMRR
jgi:hypothetical protein|tara:strand:+ start:304 stop:441 length:138 start_codon:yes stop_codon:yes gene_type:complete